VTKQPAAVRIRSRVSLSAVFHVSQLLRQPIRKRNANEGGDGPGSGCETKQPDIHKDG